MNSIIANNEEEKKFYIRMDGREAYLKYDYKNGNIIDLMSIYVPKQFRGQGIGEAIIKESLNFARKNNLKVHPTCEFAKKYLKLNTKYQDLIHTEN